MLPHTAAVLVNWNNNAELVDCVRSLLSSDYPDLRIVVVDNDSTIFDAALLRNCFPGVAIIRNPENRGFAAGLNVGTAEARKTDAKYVLFLNSDVVVDPSAIREMVMLAETSEKIGIVGPKILDGSRRNTIQSVGSRLSRSLAKILDEGRGEIDAGQFEEVKEFDYVGGCALLARASLLERVGPLDETYFLYFEENDWCLRVRREGFKVLYAPRAKIWHLGSQSTGLLTPAEREFYWYRSYILFARKNLTTGQMIVWLSFAAAHLVSHLYYLWRTHEVDLINAVFEALLWNLKNPRESWGPLKGRRLTVVQSTTVHINSPETTGDGGTPDRIDR